MVLTRKIPAIRRYYPSHGNRFDRVVMGAEVRRQRGSGRNEVGAPRYRVVNNDDEPPKSWWKKILAVVVAWLHIEAATLLIDIAIVIGASVVIGSLFLWRAIIDLFR